MTTVFLLMAVKGSERPTTRLHLRAVAIWCCFRGTAPLFFMNALTHVARQTVHLACDTAVCRHASRCKNVPALRGLPCAHPAVMKRSSPRRDGTACGGSCSSPATFQTDHPSL